MKIYQVGGSVRDKMLGRQPHDFDYVVVGSCVEEMLSAGYKQVGKDFPVFIHPESGCEYALARREIKTGHKHNEFAFVFSPDISLEDDLSRRDFTVNAMAQDLTSGKIIDPFNGRLDLQNHLLRHVNSDHFAEDPLRVLRLCRFAAKLNFGIAPQTMILAQKMVADGELQYLCAERIWKEIEKALPEEFFDIFITTAQQCGALKAILPEVDRLWQPSTTSREYCLSALIMARQHSPLVKFALLLLNIGTDFSSANQYVALDSEKLINSIGNRLKIPKKYTGFALLCCRQMANFFTAHQMKIADFFDFVYTISHKFQNQELVEDFIKVCLCYNSGKNSLRANLSPSLLEQTQTLCRSFVQIGSQIKATDMPQFTQLVKNADFAKHYRDFLLEQISRKLQLTD